MDTFPEIPDYEVLYCLGYGARSTIYAVSEKRTGQLYALKRVLRRTSDDDRFIEQAEQEFAIASQVDHPVLRKAYKLIKRRKLLKIAELYVVMELFDGTSIDVHRPAKLTRLLQNLLPGRPGARRHAQARLRPCRHQAQQHPRQ